MSEQDHYRLSEDGSLELGDAPQTWDGEPLYHPETARLFEPKAFEQMAGQTSLEADVDNSPDAVAARREMFRGFGWGVSNG
jgi:hypothetical protein